MPLLGHGSSLSRRAQSRSWLWRSHTGVHVEDAGDGRQCVRILSAGARPNAALHPR